tara:strand:- start:2351 stop:3826 length:1476 start_codon:yes stop_codon:yes gene_type:complete
MRNTTVTEKYNAVLEGNMAKKEFVRQMRSQFPMFVSNFDGFESTVQILHTRNMLFETKKETPKPAIYDKKPALSYSLDALDRGIRAELQSNDGIVNAAEYLAAEKKAKSNLEKDSSHYINLMAGETNKVDKHDREVEVKRGEAATDVFNGLKNATLREAIEGNQDGDDEELSPEELANKHAGSPMFKEDEEEDAKNDLDSYDHDFPHQDNPTTSIKSTMKEGVVNIYSKYGQIPGFGDLLKTFFDMHGADLDAGADIEDEFEQFIAANSNSLSEKQGKDHDGDGDIDGDDYMAAKDKAIKKAMGKDEGYAMKRMQQAHQQASQAGEKSAYDKKDKEKEDKEKQLKEAIKSIIKNTLNEDVINEAATNKLSSLGDEFGGYSGAQQIINDLENVVTEIEQFHTKTRDKIQKIYNSMTGIENDEGLKIGVFIGPSIESAFRQDLRPVVKKGFTNNLTIPKAKRIDPETLAQSNAQGDIEESPEAPKQTVYSPNF